MDDYRPEGLYKLVFAAFFVLAGYLIYQGAKRGMLKAPPSPAPERAAEPRESPADLQPNALPPLRLLPNPDRKPSGYRSIAPPPAAPAVRD